MYLYAVYLFMVRPDHSPSFLKEHLLLGRLPHTDIDRKPGFLTRLLATDQFPQNVLVFSLRLADQG